MLIGIDASRASAVQRTGTEAYARFLIAALLPLAHARGHTVRLYYNRPPDPSLFPDPHDAVVIPWPRLWTHLRLAYELRRRPPDLFFTPAHVIPWSYRGAAVAVVHDLGYEWFPAAHPRRQRAYLRWSTRHNARRARLVIADSQATAADLARFYAVPPATVRVVYPGRDPALVPVRDPERLRAVAARYGLTPPYLLYLGTLQPRKNLARLVAAFGRIADQIPHQLALVGRVGWLAQELQQALAALPPAARARVLLPGFTAEADKAALISGATALLFPSLHEGFGFPVLEAQACATPVLIAARSALPETAGDGALAVDPLDIAALAEAILRLVHDAPLRAQLAAAGQANLGRFSWQATATATLDVLEEAAR